jgi:ribonuclease BN (tRNA processing enzyme)
MHESVLPAIAGRRAILLTGAAGTGKSTLAAQLAAALARSGRQCACVSCDPGSPAFGMPGAVCLGVWRGDGWELVDFEPLCSLDAVRFRLPLVQAVGRLRERHAHDALLIDGPGAVRGVAAAEIAGGLAAAARADAVLALERDGARGTFSAELAALGIPVHRVLAAADAHPPSKRERALRRTARWDEYLAAAAAHDVDLERVAVVGMPPAAEAPAEWGGRQIALLRGETCVALGEADALDGAVLRARVRGDPRNATALLVRDARRGAHRLLETLRPAAPADVESRGIESVSAAHVARPQSSSGRGLSPTAKVGPFAVALLNGVFGDPLLLARLRYGRRCLLFDLGDAGRLRTRIAHDITDVFISHAHIDHVAGLLWLLRSRIGAFPPCRIYGPPGLAANVAGTVAGVHWDRVADRAPRFDVAELHGARVRRFAVTAGQGPERFIGETDASDGVLLADPLLRVRAAELDHRTPVLAYALEPRVEIKVRKERLDALGVPPGPWLTALKNRIAAGDDSAAIELPGGGTKSVHELAAQLVLVSPGEKLAYATDLADTPANRSRLIELARGAHTFFCEAPFCEPDADRAALTGHLTARACGEIATAAGVERLIPFHFSRRYESEPARVYREVRAACARTVLPSCLRD